MRRQYFALTRAGTEETDHVELMSPDDSWFHQRLGWNAESVGMDVLVIAALVRKWEVSIPPAYDPYVLNEEVVFRDVAWHPCFRITYRKPAAIFVPHSGLPACSAGRGACLVPFQMRIEYNRPIRHQRPFERVPLEYRDEPLVLTLAAAVRLNPSAQYDRCVSRPLEPMFDDARDLEPIWVVDESISHSWCPPKPWRVKADKPIWGFLDFRVNEDERSGPSPHRRLPHWHLIEPIEDTRRFKRT